jgi:hypothetical protein
VLKTSCGNWDAACRTSNICVLNIELLSVGHLAREDGYHNIQMSLSTLGSISNGHEICRVKYFWRLKQCGRGSPYASRCRLPRIWSVEVTGSRHRPFRGREDVINHRLRDGYGIRTVLFFASGPGVDTPLATLPPKEASNDNVMMEGQVPFELHAQPGAFPLICPRCLEVRWIWL